MPRNLFTPTNVRSGLVNTVPSVPRWTILPPTPSASSDLSPTPCPKEKKKSLKRRRKGMKVIPPTPELESDQEVDELEYSPFPQVVQPPPPPPNPSRRRKKKASSTTTSNTQAIPTTRPTPNLEDESCAVQAALLKVIGTSHLTITDEQKEFIDLVSKMDVKEALKIVLMLLLNNQPGPSHSDRTNSRSMALSLDTEKKILGIVKRRLRGGEKGVLYEKADYEHVISELKQYDDRGGLPEDWDLSEEQLDAVSRCTDACTSKVKGELRRQVKTAREQKKPAKKFLRSIFGIQEDGFGKKQKAFAAVMRSEYCEDKEARSYWRAVDARLKEYYNIKTHRARTAWLEEQIADDEESYPEPPPGATKRKRRSTTTDDAQRRKKQRSKAPSEEL